MSLLDPQAAPAGHSTLTLISLLPRAQAEVWFAGNPEGDDYKARKKQAGDALIAAAEKIIPGLSSHIVYRDEASPQTFGRYDWSSAGSIYGVSLKDRLKGAKSPIPGLVVAGSSTHGPGVEAAVISGAAAANALLPGLLARPPAKAQPNQKAA
jgi:phytoene dehydrogenase-like protein